MPRRVKDDPASSMASIASAASRLSNLSNLSHRFRMRKLPNKRQRQGIHRDLSPTRSPSPSVRQNATGPLGEEYPANLSPISRGRALQQITAQARAERTAIERRTHFVYGNMRGGDDLSGKFRSLVRNASFYKGSVQRNDSSEQDAFGEQATGESEQIIEDGHLRFDEVEMQKPELNVHGEKIEQRRMGGVWVRQATLEETMERKREQDNSETSTPFTRSKVERSESMPVLEERMGSTSSKNVATARVPRSCSHNVPTGNVSSMSRNQQFRERLISFAEVGVGNCKTMAVEDGENAKNKGDSTRPKRILRDTSSRVEESSMQSARPEGKDGTRSVSFADISDVEKVEYDPPSSSTIVGGVDCTKRERKRDNVINGTRNDREDTEDVHKPSEQQLDVDELRRIRASSNTPQIIHCTPACAPSTISLMRENPVGTVRVSGLPPTQVLWRHSRPLGFISISTEDVPLTTNVDGTGNLRRPPSGQWNGRGVLWRACMGSIRRSRKKEEGERDADFSENASRRNENGDRNTREKWSKRWSRRLSKSFSGVLTSFAMKQEER